MHSLVFEHVIFKTRKHPLAKSIRKKTTKQNKTRKKKPKNNNNKTIDLLHLTHEFELFSSVSKVVWVENFSQHFLFEIFKHRYFIKNYSMFAYY